MEDRHNALALERETLYPDPVRTEWKILARTRILVPHLTKQELASRLGYSYATVARWLEDMRYQRYENFLLERKFEEIVPEVADTTARVRARYVSYSEEMQLRILDIIESTTDNKLQSDLALDWLDRAGHGAVRKEQRLGVQLVLTPEAVAELHRRKLEAGL